MTTQHEKGPFVISITTEDHVGDPFKIDEDTLLLFVGASTGIVWTVQSFRFGVAAGFEATSRLLGRKFRAAGGGDHALVRQYVGREDSPLEEGYVHLIAPHGNSPFIEGAARVSPGEVPPDVLHRMVQAVDLASVDN